MTLNDLNNMIVVDKQKNCLCLSESCTAEIIGVSPSTLSNWRKGALGPEYKKVENGKKSRVLYPKTAIVEWINNTVKTV